MTFDSEHFENATQELDFYRCLTAEHMAEEQAVMDALFAEMEAEESAAHTSLNRLDAIA